MLQGGPAPGGRHVDVGHVERHVHRQEGLSGVSHLPSKWGAQERVISPRDEELDEHRISVQSSFTHLATYSVLIKRS